MMAQTKMTENSCQSGRLTDQSFRSSSKGPVRIAKVDPYGRFIELENTDLAKVFLLLDWQLKHKVPRKVELVYKVPKGVLLKPGDSIKIWAQGGGSSSDLVFKGAGCWGSDSGTKTTLYNVEGVEEASYHIRTNRIF